MSIFTHFKGRDALLSDEVPFEGHIRDDIALLKGDGVLAALEVSGVHPDTAGDQDIARWFDRLHNALKNISAEDVEVTVYQCRGECDPSVISDGIHRTEFAADLAAAYKANLLRHTLYQNKLFLTVQIYAPDVAAQTVTKFVGTAGSSPKAEIEERADRLDELCAILIGQLTEFRLVRLGYEERSQKRGVQLFDKMAEALVFALTGVWRPIPATARRMGNAMFSEEFRFRRKHIEITGAGETYYACMLAMREYPARTFPGMFFSLATATYRCTLVQSYRFLSNAGGINAIDRKQNKMLAANDKAASQTAELSVASDALMSRRWVLGMHNLVLIAFADTKKRIAEVGNSAWRDLAGCGLVAVRLTGMLQAAFLSGLPSSARWWPRPGFVKSSNLCAFSPLYSFPAGREKGHWPGPPIATLRGLAGTPYQFHWQVRDVGNAIITGSIGSGKTVAAAFLLTMTSGRARVVALDHKRGWDFLIRKLGGDYAVLGEGQPHFSPLKALDLTPRNFVFLLGLLRGCIGGDIAEEEGRCLALGLRTVMELPPEKRSIGEVRAFLDDRQEGAGVRLEKWCHGNELGWVLDAPIDTIKFGDLTGLDTTDLLENERARAPAMLYLFHRISLMLDGTPLLIPCDEGWRALIDPTFRRMLEKQIRTIRSKGGAVVFITQSPGDIIESGIARILVEQCPTQIHMANKRGRRADYIDGFGLTDGQYEAFRSIQGGDGTMLLIQGDDSSVVQIPLHGMDEYVAILSAREADLQASDRALGNDQDEDADIEELVA